MPKNKINSIAEGLIKKSLATMTEMGFITQEEAVCAVVEVKEEKVVFFIHHKLKTLISKQLEAHKPKHASVSFDNYDHMHWHVIIENDGLESFFFSRQLQRILEKFQGKEKKHKHIESNIALIKKAVSDAIRKCGGDPEKYAPVIEFKAKTYIIAITVNSIPIKIEDQKIDMVLKKISRDFLEFFKAFTGIKKISINDNTGAKVEIK